MAGRNRRKSADYFSHDSDASSDEKIVYLESMFGHKGYAVYFKFLERMARSDNFEIEWNDIKKAIYAAEFHISVTDIEQIVTECCRKEIKAFRIEDGKLFSSGLKKRMQPLLEKREYNRLKYEEKKAMHFCNRNATVKERKVKESNIKYTSDSIEYRLANYLYNFILKRNGNFKKPNIQIWAKHIDLMIRIDKRNPETIKKVIEWCQRDTPDKQPEGTWKGWANNILSTAKLREKFDKLAFKMQEQLKKQDEPSSYQPPLEEILS